MKKKFIPISPAHLIDTIIVFSILLISLIAIIIFDFLSAFSEVWVLYLCLGVYLICIFVAFCISYRGCFVVKIDGNIIESIFFKRIYCKMTFDDAQYISFLKSSNYGIDIFAKYIVLSNEPICKKNIALTFQVKKQIVIRVSSKNYAKIKTLLPQKVASHLPMDFKTFQNWVLKHEIHLLKQNDGEFLLRYQF